MITLSSVHFKLHETPFFNDLSASFKEGYLHTISGKNGTGKSTLLRILHGDAQAEFGTIIINNTTIDLNGNNTQVQLKKMIGFVPQQSSAVIIPGLTVEENLRIAAIKNISLLSPLPSFENSLIKQFKIPLNADASSLSGGQKHILAIAMVLQHHKEVLLLDEPTAALDDENANAVLKCIEMIVNQGIVVIMVTHDPIIVKTPIHSWILKKEADGTRQLS